MIEKLKNTSFYLKTRLFFWVIFNYIKLTNYAWQVYHGVYTDKLNQEEFRRAKGRELFKNAPWEKNSDK